MIRTGGGTFDSQDPFVYFIASNVERQQWGQKTHKNVLVAINEINSEDNMKSVAEWLGNDRNVFIDSGVFNLAMEHARKHSVSHDIALSLAPGEIDGFDNLLERYVEIIRKFEDDAWGYIEIDQGGRENKIKTRAMLEGMGLRPIPVYHPFLDGWDYFDYLAERYDRICFGNVVQADRNTRKRLVATAWERKRKYPDLWIHLLGLTPNEWLYGFPISSGDSSTWLSAVRWSGYADRTAGKSIGHLPKNFQYQLGSDGASEVGSQKACTMSAYGAFLNELNWRNHLRTMEGLGCTIYPPLG